MTEKMIYVANDGKEFESKTECQTYENLIFSSNSALKNIYFFKGSFNLYTPISKYVGGFQFVGGKPIYERATNKIQFISLFHDCNIIYTANEEAVRFLREIIDDTDYDSFGIGVGVNIWSDGEWHNMDKEIKDTTETLKKFRELNEFFSSLDDFNEANG